MTRIPEPQLTLLSPDSETIPPEWWAPDIIAVPGLGGSSSWGYNIETQSPDIDDPDIPTTFWLRDWIPRDFPVARIYTYDYSPHVFRNSSLFISNAKHLLTKIQHLRTKQKTPRPIVFVCHSLGGLIAKAALTNAREQEELDSYDGLLRSIRGCLFFGTPHSGLLSDLTATLGKLDACGSSSSASRVAVNMQSIMLGFAKLVTLLPWHIISFYEQLPLPSADGLVVNYHQVELLAFPRISIHRNHQKLCCFSSSHDQTYQQVAEAIRKIMSINPTQKDFITVTADSASILQEQEILRALQVDNALESISNAHPGTCDWVFDNQTFRSWVERPSDILWILGEPGSGKTTLSKYLFEAWPQQMSRWMNPKMTSKVVFFCCSSQESEGTLIRLLRAWLHQLLVSMPDTLATEILASFAERREVQGLDQPWEESFLIEELLRLVRRSTALSFSICFILDGLDEIQDPLSVVALLHRLETTSTSDGRVWICVLCRSRSDLRLHTNLAITTGSADNTHGLERFVSHHIVEAAAWHGEATPPAAEVQKLSKIITKKSSGLYLWAHLLVTNLFSYPEERYIHHIRGLTELDRFYEAILGRLRISQNRLRRETAQRALLLALYSKRHLTIMELCDALEAHVSSRHGRQSREHPGMQVVERHVEIDYDNIAYQIAILSGGLLAFMMPKFGRRKMKAPGKAWPSMPTVMFIHNTARDFLHRETIAKLFANIEHMHMPCAKNEPDFELAKLCLHCIDVSPEPPRTSLKCAATTAAGFLKYSVLHVMTHLRSASKRGLDPSADKLWKTSPFSPAFLNKWICLHRAVSGNYRLFEPHKSTPAHVMCYFDLPWLHTPAWAAEKGPLSLDQADHRGLTPLSIAAAQGCLDNCKVLVASGANVNHRDYMYGQTPLSLAAAHGHAHVVEFLLCARADITLGRGPQSPLWMAVHGSNLCIVELLLNCGADPHSFNVETGETVLDKASAVGHVPIVQTLLNHGTKIGLRDKEGWTALHYAISRGRKRTLEVLIDAVGPDHYVELKISLDQTRNSWVATVFRAVMSDLAPCDHDATQTSFSQGDRSHISQNVADSQICGRNPGQKRSREKTGHYGNEDHESDGKGPSEKRLRQSPSCTKRFACPYHQKNPIKHAGGACNGKGFDTIYRLKTHLKRHHQIEPAHRCHICKQRFRLVELEGHQPCIPKPHATDHEEGFDSAQHRELESKHLFPRKSSHEECWRVIFKILFPNWPPSRDLPSPYLDDSSEVHNAQALGNLQRTLHDIIGADVVRQQLLEEAFIDFRQRLGASAGSSRAASLLPAVDRSIPTSVESATPDNPYLSFDHSMLAPSNGHDNVYNTGTHSLNASSSAMESGSFLGANDYSGMFSDYTSYSGMVSSHRDEASISSRGSFPVPVVIPRGDMRHNPDQYVRGLAFQNVDLAQEGDPALGDPQSQPQPLQHSELPSAARHGVTRQQFDVTDPAFWQNLSWEVENSGNGDGGGGS